MEKDRKAEKIGEIVPEDERMSRREFFAGLGKWSLVVIGAALGGSALLASERDAEAYGGAWANRGGGGGAWANRAGGGGAWANHGSGGGGWANRAGGGGAWANRAGGGGTGWVNRF